MSIVTLLRLGCEFNRSLERVTFPSSSSEVRFDGGNPCLDFLQGRLCKANRIRRERNQEENRDPLELMFAFSGADFEKLSGQ